MLILEQREFTNDCIFNERLENNYNYYTSTHHSTSLRTYYLALNRLGAPRKTHLPSNKPLGKLSTYAKAFTLAVPEPRSEAIIGQRFGFNHITHGIKHLCESGKQLMELTRKQLVYPECSTANGGSGTSSSGISISPSSSLSKQQPNHHHIRHANQNHRSSIGPAALTDLRSTKNKKNATPTATAKAGNCNSEPCHKKKKNNNNNVNGNRGGGNHNHNSNSNTNHNHNHHHHHHHHNPNANKKNAKRTNPKPIKRPTKKAPTTTKATTTRSTTTTTTTTTESAITPSSSNVPDYEDDAEYVQITSNEQTGLISDEDYDYDE